MMRPPPRQHQIHKWHWLRSDSGEYAVAAWSEKWGWAGVPPYVAWKYHAPAIPPSKSQP